THSTVSPREYLRRIYVDALVHDSRALQYLLDQMGSDRVALGSDYPFPLGEAEPGALIRSMGLPRPIEEDLFFRTACALLGGAPGGGGGGVGKAAGGGRSRRGGTARGAGGGARRPRRKPPPPRLRGGFPSPPPLRRLRGGVPVRQLARAGPGQRPRVRRSGT